MRARTHHCSSGDKCLWSQRCQMCFSCMTVVGFRPKWHIFNAHWSENWLMFKYEFEDTFFNFFFKIFFWDFFNVLNSKLSFWTMILWLDQCAKAWIFSLILYGHKLTWLKLWPEWNEAKNPMKSQTFSHSNSTIFQWIFKDNSDFEKQRKFVETSDFLKAQINEKSELKGLNFKFSVGIFLHFLALFQSVDCKQCSKSTV